MKQQKNKDSAAEIYAVRKKKKRRRFLTRCLWFVLIAAAIMILYDRREVWLPKLETIGVRHQSQRQSDPATADGNFPLYITGAENYQFSSIGDHLALLSDSYFFIYETGGSQIAARQHTYGSAMLQTAGDYALVYELGGTNFRLETVRRTRYEKSVANHIIFGRVSENGMTALVTASETSACTLLVFNAKGQQIYARNCIELLGELTFNPDESGCYAVSMRADGGAMQSVVHAYSFSEEEELWSGQPLDMLAVSVYNTEGDNLFVLGDTQACYLSNTGAVLSTYVYPDTLVSGCCEKDGTAALLLSNDEKRSDSVVILKGSAKDAVLRTYDKEIKSIGLLSDGKSVLLQMRSKLVTLSSDGVVMQETETQDSYDSFLRIGNYLFLIGYDHIDRLTFRSGS